MVYMDHSSGIRVCGDKDELFSNMLFGEIHTFLNEHIHLQCMY